MDSRKDYVLKITQSAYICKVLFVRQSTDAKKQKAGPMNIGPAFCFSMSPLGLEPRTHGLKGRCSAIELGTRTHESNYTLLNRS